MPSIRDRRTQIARAFTEPRLAIMLALGFSSGLPFLLVFGTLSAWLREAGVSRTEIGMLSWVALAYSLKFIWAPAIDRIDLPVLARLLGRRRAWMLAAQLLVAVGLAGLAIADPAHFLLGTVAMALLVAFAGATQDVAIDGWRIDAAPTEEQGMLSAVYQLGYRLALICSGAGALYLAEFVDWRTAYFAMAAMTLVGIIATLLAPVARPADRAGAPAPAVRPGFSFASAVLEPFTELVRRKGTLVVLILAMISIYRLPDFVSGIMANPLYIDLGFSKSEIASVSKLYGVWIGILGAFAGGIAIARAGLMPCLVVGGIAGAASNLMFAWLATAGHRLDLLTLSISLDNFASGFAGTALIAYMSGLTSPAMAATQYALLSSLYALPGKFVGGLSGVMVDQFGYPTFFVLTALVGVPVAVLSLLIWRFDRESAQTGRRPVEAEETEPLKERSAPA
ncbi:AmpG family muropeptide MFS transporter [Chelatococcus reniformis]|uniref:MFS transporter n=1 Tax=Chelatococcus reniformis TaxID=1494448 RepID=A0A916X6Y6_9HYPH|nr:AmpG family muropeptide MFS transporter [Chelatococcus reniformis]GGC47719.1 MFS transporter [Chelatococcus reniformis]